MPEACIPWLWRAGVAVRGCFIHLLTRSGAMLVHDCFLQNLGVVRD